MKTKRILALLVTVMMIFTIIPQLAFAEEQASFDNFKAVQTYTDGQFTDVKNTDWFSENLKSVYEFALMVGRSETEFAPEENMTVAEAMTIAARLNSIYKTGKADFTEGEPWYQVYTDYCKANGIADISNYDPDALITRGQFAEIFANALPEEALAQINEIVNGAIPDVKEGDAFSKAIYDLYRAGILVGNDDKGTFASNTNIKRMEVTAITGRMAVPSQRQKISLTAEPEEKEEYTVSFDLNYDGKTLNSVTVKDGEKVSAPKSPSRTDYNFVGWYTAKSGGTKFNFSKVITADITLYAHWSKVSSGGGGSSRSYTVTFVSDKGEALEPVTVKSGNKITEPTVSEVEGFYVEGWYKEAEFQNKWYFDTDKVTANTTIYANWIEENRTFKAVYSETDGSLTFYFDNVNHSTEGTVYENGTENILFDDTKDYGEKWGYNSIRAGITGVVIDPSVAKFKGLTSTTFMFYNMQNAESISGTEYLDVSNTTDMSYMFYKYGSASTVLTAVPDVSNWNTGKVTNMNRMFWSYGNNSTVLAGVPDVSKWNTGNVTDMSYMFSAYGYKSQTLNAVPNVSEWNTGNVTNMSSMFNSYGYSSAALKVVPDVSNWDIGSVTNMSYMFDSYGYSSTVLNAVPAVNGNNWNTEKVTNIAEMFYSYGKNSTALTKVPDVSKWNISGVTDMNHMFNYYGSNSEVLEFKLDLSGWDLAGKDANNMFDDAGISATTWSVTIPATTGEHQNDSNNWYFGDCTDSIKPATDKQFTVATPTPAPETKTLEEILATYGTDFPASAEDAWKCGDLPMYCRETTGGCILTIGTTQMTDAMLHSDTAIKVNGGYEYTNDDKYSIFFKVDENKLVAVTIKTISDEFSIFAGTYALPVPPETGTLAQILATNTKFPIAEDDLIPENAWVNERGAQAFVNPDGMLCFVKVGNANTLDVATTETFTKVGDNFVFEDTDATFTCIIKDGKLDSIKIETENTDYTDLVGTYAPAPLPEYTNLLGEYSFSAYDYFNSCPTNGTLVVEEGVVNESYKISIPGIGWCPEQGQWIDHFLCTWDKTNNSFTLNQGEVGDVGEWSYGALGYCDIVMDIFYFDAMDDIDNVVFTADDSGNLTITSPTIPQDDYLCLQSGIYKEGVPTGYANCILVFNQGLTFTK